MRGSATNINLLPEQLSYISDCEKKTQGYIKKVKAPGGAFYSINLNLIVEYAEWRL